MSQQVKFTLYFAGREVETDGLVEMFSQKERGKKALKAFGICWLVALICVFVPVLHFVLTPMAALMGPFAAFFVYKKVKDLPKLAEGRVFCLNCQTETHFRFIEAKPPLYDACLSCKTGYQVLWPPKGLMNEG